MKIFDWVFDKFYHNDLLFLIILVYTNSSRPHRSLRNSVVILLSIAATSRPHRSLRNGDVLYAKYV